MGNRIYYVYLISQKTPEALPRIEFSNGRNLITLGLGMILRDTKLGLYRPPFRASLVGISDIRSLAVFTLHAKPSLGEDRVVLLPIIIELSAQVSV